VGNGWPNFIGPHNFLLDVHFEGPCLEANLNVKRDLSESFGKPHPRHRNGIPGGGSNPASHRAKSRMWHLGEKPSLQCSQISCAGSTGGWLSRFCIPPNKTCHEAFAPKSLPAAFVFLINDFPYFLPSISTFGRQGLTHVTRYI
jgi:hypothetical protein